MFTLLRKVRRSAIFAVYGSSSLTHAPDWPCCANANFEGTTGKAGLRGRHAGEPLAAAHGLRQIGALELAQARLVVEQLHLRGAARLEQVDDALGLRREMRQPGQTAVSSGARIAAPEPGQRRQADARRIHAEEMPPRHAIHAYSFVIVSSRFNIRLATLAYAASSRSSSPGRTGDSPCLRNSRGSARVGAKARRESVQRLQQRLPPRCIRRARQHQAVSVIHALLRRRAAFRHHALRQFARGLQKRDVVHQIQRLQRRVGAVLEHRALLAIGRIEVHMKGGATVRFQ